MRTNGTEPRRIPKWIHDIWKDPVWSKVIAAAILALLGIAAAYYDAERSLTNVERWMSRSMFLERWEYIASLAAAFVVGVLVAIVLRIHRQRADETPAQPTTGVRPALGAVLEKADWSVLKVYGLSPAPLSVNAVAASLRKIDRPRILLAIDRLKKVDLLLGAGMNASNEAQFELTAQGREECHRKGWI